MSCTYEVRMNEEIVFTSGERSECHIYINKKHGDIIEYFTYCPYGDGKLERWENGINKIDLVELPKKSTNIIDLLENHKSKIYIPTEIKTSSRLPLTPKRTRIKQKNKKQTMEKAGKGKKFTDQEGNNWVSVKYRDGKYRWEKYLPKTYTTTNTKIRKSPKEPAKNFSEGTKKEGLDGNFWTVKITKNGVKKWFKIC